MMRMLLETSNTLTALAGCAIFMLCLRGFVKRVPSGFKRETSATWFRRSLVVLLAMCLVRMGWWDIVWPVLKYQGFVMPRMTYVCINTAANMALFYAAFCALKSLYYNIPEHRRGQYNLFSAPWAPDTFRIWGIWK